MNGEEKWWQSRTLWGAGIALAAFVLTWFGVGITPEEQATATDLILAVAIPAGYLVAFILTIVGRLKATKEIAKKVV